MRRPPSEVWIPVLRQGLTVIASEPVVASSRAVRTTARTEQRGLGASHPAHVDSR